MKKLYTIVAATMMSLAAGAAAIVPPVGDINPATLPAGIDMNKQVAKQLPADIKFSVSRPAAKAEGPMRTAPIVEGATLVDGTTLENATTVDRAAISAGRAAISGESTENLGPRRAGEYPAASELSGTYVMTYGPAFVNFDLSREMCQDVILTFKANGQVEIDQLFQVGKSTPSNNANNLYNCKNITGTYNQETGELTVLPGQRFANLDISYYDEESKQTINNKLALQIDWADLVHGDYSTFPPIVFKYDDGAFYCQSDIQLQFYDTEEGLENTPWFLFDAGRRPVLRRPNATLNYATYQFDTEKFLPYSRPVAYGFQTIDEDEYMWVTNVNVINQGYITWWKVDGDKAIADNEKVYSYATPDSEGNITNDKAYYLNYLDDEGNLHSAVDADISNRQRVIFPISSLVWTAISPEGNYWGLFSQADITGTWVDPPKVENFVTIYNPFFNNYDTSRPMTTIGTMRYGDNGSVEIEGLGGITRGLADANTAYTDIAPVSGTLSADGKTITIANGQQVGTYGGNVALRLYGADLAAGEYYTSGSFNLVQDGKTWKPEVDLYVVGNGKGYAAQLDPVLAKAKGNLTYTGVDALSGYTIDEPVWYSFATNESGDNCLYISNLAQRAGTGYITEWAIDEEGFAIADKQVAYSFASPAASRVYYLSTILTEGAQPTPAMAAYVIDNNTIAFTCPIDEDGTQPRWTIASPDGHQLGFNNPGWITGYPTQPSTGSVDPIDPPVDPIPATLCVIHQAPDYSYDLADVTPLTRSGNTFSGRVSFDRAGFYLGEHAGVTGGDWSTVGRLWGTDVYSIFEDMEEKIVEDAIGMPFLIALPHEGVEYPMTCEVNVNFDNMTILIRALVTGVEGVAIDAAVPTTFYNLQGVRVDNPQGGLYIVKRGDKATKTFVK